MSWLKIFKEDVTNEFSKEAKRYTRVQADRK